MAKADFIRLGGWPLDAFDFSLPNLLLLMQGSGLGNDTICHHFGFVLKDSHGGIHLFEAKFGVKAFYPRIGIQDDLSVAFREFDKVLNDLFPQAKPLIFRMDRNST